MNEHIISNFKNILDIVLLKQNFFANKTTHVKKSNSDDDKFTFIFFIHKIIWMLFLHHYQSGVPNGYLLQYHCFLSQPVPYAHTLFGNELKNINWKTSTQQTAIVWYLNSIKNANAFKKRILTRNCSPPCLTEHQECFNFSVTFQKQNLKSTSEIASSISKLIVNPIVLILSIYINNIFTTRKLLLESHLSFLSFKDID